MLKSDVDALLIRIARQAIENDLSGGGSKLAISNLEILDVYADPHGVFVTLWSKNGNLRGCIGRHHRTFDRLEEEISDCAVLSATEDPRFPPVSLEECDDLGIEISLLSKPEKVQGPEALDPHCYGVIVKSGIRQATLLPEIEGIDTIEQQLDVVFRKAGIPRTKPVDYYRFEVNKIKEVAEKSVFEKT